MTELTLNAPASREGWVPIHLVGSPCDGQETAVPSDLEARIEQAAFCTRTSTWCVGIAVRNSWVCVFGWVFLGQEAELRFEAQRDSGPLCAVWDRLSGGGWEKNTLWLPAITAHEPVDLLEQELTKFVSGCRFCVVRVGAPDDELAVLPATGYRWGDRITRIPSSPTLPLPAVVCGWLPLLELGGDGMTITVHGLEGKQGAWRFFVVWEGGADSGGVQLLAGWSDVLVELDRLDWTSLTPTGVETRFQDAIWCAAGRRLRNPTQRRAWGWLAQREVLRLCPDADPENADWIRILSARRIAETVPGARLHWEEAVKAAGGSESSALGPFYAKLRQAGVPVQ